MNPIIISGIGSATIADLLNDTRLQTVPANGVLTVEFQASANNGSNNAKLSVKLPGGDAPMSDVNMPQGATGGALNANDKMQASFVVAQGGHTQISVAVTGTVAFQYRITYTPL